MASGSQRRFLDWEERFVSHDRGSRVVHYYLRDRHGHQCLAVIGTERSLRHMVYVVCDDFLPLSGLDKSTTSAFKWRARREVVDWLSAFLAKSRTPDTLQSAGSPRNVVHSSTDADSAYSYEGAEGLESSLEECRSRHHDVYTRKRCSSLKADVLWVGSAWSCRKRLRHFHSFQRNGITISVQDFVYVLTEEKDRHIAYVEDLFEDKKLRKKLRVRWFHKPSELTCRIPPPAPHSREVFYTAFQQDLSVECVDGVAVVLAPEHHSLCLAALPSDIMSQVLMCYREFDSDGIKPFSIQDVKGYWRQTVLSLAGLVSAHENSPQSDHGSEDVEIDDDGADAGRVVRRGPRTARCSRRRAGLSKGAVRLSGDVGVDTTCTSAEAGGSGSGERKFMSSKGGSGVGENYEEDLCRIDIGDHIEVLSEDSGLRGCWFKGTVLRKAFRRIEVRYDDVVCEDEKGNLEEWVPSCRIAEPCKHGIRISGRPSIRPCPPKLPCSLTLNEGEVVDVWWHDGWWEAIVCGRGTSGLVHVYIPGEQEKISFKETDLRVSKEWWNGTWVRIPSHPDVVVSLGLAVPSVNDMEAKVGQICGNITTGERSESNLYRGPCVSETVHQGQGGHEGDVNLAACSVKEFLTSCVMSASECIGQYSLVNPTPECARAVVEIPEAEADLVKQECEDDGVTGDYKQSQGTSPSLGLKWKAGRKRHRQGDLVTSRVDRGGTTSANEAKDSSPDSMKEEVSSDRTFNSMVREDVENIPRWKNGDGEDILKFKKPRQGNDNSLKALHGPAMGSSLFIGSMPIANLVMSSSTAEVVQPCAPGKPPGEYEHFTPTDPHYSQGITVCGGPTLGM